MNKYEKFILIFGLILLVFLGGMFLGEHKVINEQKVYSADNGYIVEFDGHNYLYN